jgi:hypothetical protein
MRWKAYFLAVLTTLIIAAPPCDAGVIKRFFLRCAMVPVTVVTVVCLGHAVAAGTILDKLEEHYLEDLYNDEAKKRYALRRR